LTGAHKDRERGDSTKNYKDKRSQRFFMSICNSVNGNSPASLDRPMPGNAEFDTYFLDDDNRQDTNNRLITGMHCNNPSSKFRMQL